MEKERRNPNTSFLIPKLEEDILHYLPVKSLIRFKSVSKQWRSMIESSYFIKKHHVCSFSNPKLLVIRSKKTRHQNYFHLETYSRDHQGENDAKISLSSFYLQVPSTTVVVVGSCDGLVCIQSKSDCLQAESYIINPATRKLWQINRGFMMLSQTGFGKDMVTGKYKMIFLYDSEGLDYDVLPKTRVVTLGNGNVGSEQREIGYFPVSEFEISNEQASVFANGSVFWLTKPSFESDSLTPIELVALDLHTEKFRRVSWPSWYVEHSFGMRIWNLKDRLCLSNVIPSSNLDVWSLKKMEDSSEQWEKFFTINVSSIGRLDTKFWMLCLDAAYVRGNIDIDKIPSAIRETTLYREALVSPYPSI